MKKKNYSIILCGGLFLASCMSNNDKCLQKLFDEVGVEKSQIHNATHLVTIFAKDAYTKLCQKYITRPILFI